MEYMRSGERGGGGVHVGVGVGCAGRGKRGGRGARGGRVCWEGEENGLLVFCEYELETCLRR